MIKYNKTLIYTLSTVVILFCCQVKMESARQYFVYGEFGGMKPDETPGCSENTWPQGYIHDDFNKDMSCRLMYTKRNDKGLLIYSPVSINGYLSEDYVFSDFLKLYRRRATANDDYKIIENGNGSILSREDIISARGDEKYSSNIWLSGKHIIDISSHHTFTPSELLSAYLEKYPPTQKFKREDFADYQFIFSKEIEKNFEIIANNEDRRGIWNSNIDKNEEFQAAVVQCEREAAIRCYTGLTTDEECGCPIAMTLGAGDRKQKYSELKKQAAGKKIVEENIVWANPENALIPDCIALNCHKRRLSEKLGVY